MSKTENVEEETHDEPTPLHNEENGVPAVDGVPAKTYDLADKVLAQLIEDEDQKGLELIFDADLAHERLVAAGVSCDVPAVQTAIEELVGRREVEWSMEWEGTDYFILKTREAVRDIVERLIVLEENTTEDMIATLIEARRRGEVSNLDEARAVFRTHNGQSCCYEDYVSEDWRIEQAWGAACRDSVGASVKVSP